LIDLGSVDFNIGPPLPGYKPYTHDTRTVEAPGGGLEFRVFHGILLRADYEYQMWPDFLSKTLDPQGFTVGVQYDFRALHRR